ncbi:47 kDa outer membrane protein [Aquicella siphonis]|uniref:47 kDa outer membrane protein n=1 Tax=Aquicella siphonis TaxID=254247 RepID=A0A5E4PG30_9COXI|nr:outer membrane protein transport protein [Aquicella siphonis]VVC75879.1 47 kDa outer membrane protein [Aquicella siphonis]
MKRFVMRPLVTVLCASGLLGSTQAMASAFQLWEQDGASVGNYHAGYAAEANDASITWYNPAGITRIKNQQFVLGGSAIASDFKYQGSVGVTELSPVFNPFPIPHFQPVTVNFDSVTAQGGGFSIIPNLQYVAPINDWIGFGFSVDVPFGLKTSYGTTSPMRYAATLTSIRVVDISPALGMQITDKASVGAGFDIQRAYAEFDSVAALIDPSPFSINKTVITSEDTRSTNKANDTGYGFRLGFMYEFNPCTRMGISYHSQVVHHFSGSSKFIGPITEIANAEHGGGPIVSSRATTNVKLPPYTALSVFHKATPSWAFMGTLVYTQWNTFKTLTLNQVAGLVNDPVTLVAPSTDIQISIPENYRNSWNLSLGANYYPTETIIIRSGIGYDQSPVRDRYRNVQLPDSDRYALALGGHFQATKTIGLDVGWSHIFFFGKVKVNPPPQVNGAETVSTNGHVKGGADVLSGQVTWDIV